MLPSAPVFIRTIACVTQIGISVSRNLRSNHAFSIEAMRRSQRIATQNLSKSNRFYSSNRSSGNAVIVVLNEDTFSAIVEGKREAFLYYEQEGRVLKLMHTEVPEELQGRGLGKILAKAALDHVARNNLQMEIHCDFLRDYVENVEPKYLKYLRK